MLEHVALNQTRFHTPGIAPDTRGVVLGKLGALLFPSVDKLVGCFAILSDELPLDDLLPTLKICEIRTPLKSREFLVLFQASSSYFMDRASRVARFLGGLAFTGTSKHFVKYRDDSSPLGYDVDQLSTDGADFLLYADAFTQSCMRVREIPFAQLVFRLSLRRLPGGGDEPTRDVLWLSVERGLARSVITYLWRNRVPVAATFVERDAATGAATANASVGGAFGGAAGYLLARVSHLPERMLALFQEVPGIEVHQPLGDNFVVEVGWRHPLRLEACQTLFEKDRFYLFSGKRDSVDVLMSLPPLVQGDRLLAVGFVLGDAERTRATHAGPTPAMHVDLSLVPSASPPRRVTATLIPWERAAWLKKLVFALPPTVLSGYRVAPVADGLLVRGAQGVDGLPVGELLQEAAPAIYLPVGYEFLPRISEAVLTEHVGGVQGRCIIFRRVGEKPFAVSDDAFEPLGRRLLGRLEVELHERSARLARTPPPVEPAVSNEPAGALPLWGFQPGPPPDVDV